MNMKPMFNECMKPHALVHLITGASIAFLLVNFFPGLTTNALMIAIVLFVVAFILEFVVNPARKQ
jgi:hypothetical protein